MHRLILLCGVLGLCSGCGETDGQPSGEATSTAPRQLKGGSSTAQLAEDFVAESWKGVSYEIIAVQELHTRYQNTAAVAVYLHWRIKGEDEPRHDLLLVQDGRVKLFNPYDTGKSLEENAAAAVKD